MDNLPGAPLPPDSGLTLMEMSILCSVFGALCVIAGLFLLWVEKKGRK